MMNQPAETMSSLGAQLLLEHIVGKAGPRSRRAVLQTDLVVRVFSCVKFGGTNSLADEPVLYYSPKTSIG